MTQPPKISTDQISYHCAVLCMKTSVVLEAQIRIIIYGNKNMPSSRKPHHDCNTSMHCEMLQYFTLTKLHSTATCYFECTAKCCNIHLYKPSILDRIHQHIAGIYKASFSWQGYKISPFSEMFQLALVATHLPIQ